MAKAGALVPPEAQISLAAPPRLYVNRGGEKLAAVLAHFGLSAADKAVCFYHGFFTPTLTLPHCLDRSRGRE
jgi:predicted rRNA methylase YqxC with S4 and FtsJ domains